ncbi:hypothetical protein [Pseudooceanicola sp. MF1-13]|uniref:protein-tyrosine phosphatase family protein n=1 Tax=Pseudooceanicola sp. MF1-13 TaxID=3379095 RepID=UPI0038911F51
MTDEHETSVRAIVSGPNGTRILTSGFPGLQSGIDGTAYIDPHNLKATMSAIHSAGASTLVVLTEADELPVDAMTHLGEAARNAGVQIETLPIPDYHAPSDETLAQWDALATRRDWPDTQNTLAFCCQYGAGRSGTMAAYVLIRQGLSKDEAIKTVRDGFAESIESEVQLEFLEKISARLKDQAPDLDPD